ncbi:MAG: hypothetical protein WBA46_00980 [Thermomicrobiales bacterium]
MSNERLNKELRNSGWFEAFEPAAKLRHEQAIRDTVDPAGKLSNDEARRLRTPEKIDWSTIDGRPKRTAQAGTMYLIWAHSNVAPTSTCTITYTMETRQQGATPIGTVTIAAGQQIGEASVAQPLPAGAYLNPTVTVAGGASGVSTGVLIKGGV